MLGFVAYSQAVAIRELQRQVLELSAKVESKARNASLDLQEKCAKQAQEVFKVSGKEKEQLAGFENHYNEKLNRCFMTIQDTDVKTAPGGITTSKFLLDAFEGKYLGTFIWQSDKLKKAREVPPFQCDVTLPSGEKRVCHSSDEFNELVRGYMQ
jgi:hypothetical protein